MAHDPIKRKEYNNIGQLTWDKSGTNLRTTSEANVKYGNKIMKHVCNKINNAPKYTFGIRIPPNVKYQSEANK
jgi:hypothetical protein